MQVERYNLSQQPGAFVSHAVVKDALNARGNGCLPLIVVDDRIAAEGTYPARDTLAALAGVVLRKLEVAPTSATFWMPQRRTTAKCCERQVRSPTRFASSSPGSATAPSRASFW